MSGIELIVFAEAIGEKDVQFNIFLPHKAARHRKLPVAKQIYRDAGSGGSGDLNGAPVLLPDLLVVDLARIRFIRIDSVPPARGAAKHQNDILARHGNGAVEDAPQFALSFKCVSQFEAVDQEIHQVMMAGVANRFIVQFVHLSFQRLAQGTKTA